ncbi:MAG: lasso peptide [Bacteroidota bacterium]
MKTYSAPMLTEYGDVAAITATLGDPFTGDQSFDVDGNVIEEGLNSINQCPTLEFETCHFENP